MMQNEIAIDTNVLIYILDQPSSPKYQRADRLLAQKPSISVQVVSELLNVCKRLMKVPKTDVLNWCRLLISDCALLQVTHQTLLLAEELIDEYDFQVYDAIVIAAAFEAGCTVLYSEDMQHNLLVREKLRVINPFC